MTKKSDDCYNVGALQGNSLSQLPTTSAQGNTQAEWAAPNMLGGYPRYLLGQQAMPQSRAAAPLPACCSQAQQSFYPNYHLPVPK